MRDFRNDRGQEESFHHFIYILWRCIHRSLVWSVVCSLYVYAVLINSDTYLARSRKNPMYTQFGMHHSLIYAVHYYSYGFIANVVACQHPHTLTHTHILFRMKAFPFSVSVLIFPSNVPVVVRSNRHHDSSQILFLGHEYDSTQQHNYWWVCVFVDSTRTTCIIFLLLSPSNWTAKT